MWYLFGCGVERSEVKDDCQLSAMDICIARSTIITPGISGGLCTSWLQRLLMWEKADVFLCSAVEIASLGLWGTHES